jgi:transcriptional regulator with XRE-family HTH domain
MNFAELFSQKLKQWHISGKELAEASGRSEANISQIRNAVVSPSIADFQKLIEICDGLKPGFAEDYYASLSPLGAIGANLLALQKQQSPSLITN